MYFRIYRSYDAMVVGREGEVLEVLVPKESSFEEERLG